MPSVLAGEKPNWKKYFITHFPGSNNNVPAKEAFKDFEFYYNQYGATVLSDIVQLFWFCVAGKARTWLDRYTTSTKEAFKKDFLKQFGNTKSLAEFSDDFCRIKLGEGEDLQSYRIRFEEACVA